MSAAQRAGALRDDQLDRVERARPDLDLLAGIVLDQLLALDPLEQRGVVIEEAVEAQHVRDEVVGEHRQPIEVVERRHAGAGEVGGRDLRALEERHREAVVDRGVGERVPAGQRLDERDGRAAGGVGDRREPAVVVGADVPAEVVQRARRTAPSARGPGPGRACRRPRRCRSAESSSALHGPWSANRSRTPVRDREVSRPALALAERREPARAEVDRVERQPERRQLLARAGGQVGLGIRGRYVGVERQRADVGRGPLGLDAHVLGLLGDLRAGRSQCGQDVAHSPAA